MGRIPSTDFFHFFRDTRTNSRHFRKSTNAIWSSVSVCQYSNRIAPCTQSRITGYISRFSKRDVVKIHSAPTDVNALMTNTAEIEPHVN